MICTTCGGDMQSQVTDLPFKVGERSIVIVKDLPVIECPHCGAYLLHESVMAHVERILASADDNVELTVLRYAA